MAEESQGKPPAGVHRGALWKGDSTPNRAERTFQGEGAASRSSLGCPHSGNAAGKIAKASELAFAFKGDTEGLEDLQQKSLWTEAACNTLEVCTVYAVVCGLSGGALGRMTQQTGPQRQE